MPTSPEAAWSACLEIIRDNVSPQSFVTWFEPLKPLRLEEAEGLHKLTVQVPSRFYYEWLEEHYFGLLRRTVTKVLGSQGRLFYEVVIEQEQDDYEGSSVQLEARPPEPRPHPGASQNGAAEKGEGNQQQGRPSAGTPVPRRTAPQGGRPQQGVRRPTQRPGAQQTNVQRPGTQGQGGEQASLVNPFAVPGIKVAELDSNLNDAYVFERFIEGDCNQLARSASLAIAEQPGATSFNPFLVYGGVGLGKTHLIHAIGNYAKQHGKAETVLYVSSEQFTTEFVQSIQHNRVSEFSLFYRQIDVLIVDDVQFFSGKEKTQEEFFHIFNALHQSGRQIVLSSDRAPGEIQGIEERLLSRFNWGLAADVQPPGLETRIAILQRKADEDGIDVSQEVLEFIAHNVRSNIRELESALIRLLAHSTLHRRDLDLSLAKEVLRDLVKEATVNLTIEEIQRIVCDYFGTPEDLVRAKTRKREIVQTRQIAMYFCKDLTQHSLKTIGLHFGGRDHSTVIHAVRTVENNVETDPKYAEMVEEISRKIELRSR